MPLVVHPHFHPRRTGVTRHVEAIVPALRGSLDARVLGGEVIDPAVARIGWRDVWRRSRSERVVWHAHRNNELFAGLLLRVLGARLRLVFTRHASHRPSAVTRLLSRRADRCVALTGEIARVLALPSAVVGHGVDLARFEAPEDRLAAWESLGLGGRYGIGVIGRIRAAKGQGDFVAAIAPLLDAHPEWKAVLVGGARGGDRAWAEELRARTAGRLMLAGEQADPVPWYRGLTVLVHPSWAEGHSMVLLEGLAAGCCVVASALPHHPEIVEHGRTGFLYPPGDAEALREILESLLREPARAERIGRAAAEDARRRFGLDQEARALTELYEELLTS